MHLQNSTFGHAFAGCNLGFLAWTGGLLRCGARVHGHAMLSHEICSFALPLIAYITQRNNATVRSKPENIMYGK